MGRCSNIAGWRQWVQRFVNLPWLVQVGLSLMALGGAGDVAYHSIGGLSHTMGHALHLLTFVGMVATLAGIVLETAN